MNRTTRRNLVVIAASVLAAVVLGFALDRVFEPRQPRIGADEVAVRDGKIMPDAPLMFLDGTRGGLRAYAGKVILVHFWASWCVPCVAEFPTLVDLAARHPDTLQIVAISADEQKENIAPFLERMGKSLPDNFTISWDPDKDVIQGVFQTVLYPETIIVSADLKMVDKISGPYEDWADADMAEKLAPLLAAAQTNL